MHFSFDKSYISAALVTVMMGCGGNAIAPIKQEALEELRAATTIYAVHYETPYLRVYPSVKRSDYALSLFGGMLTGTAGTVGKAGGVATGAATSNAGRYLASTSSQATLSGRQGEVEAYARLDNPAIRVKETFLLSWQKSLGHDRIINVQKPAEDRKVSGLQAAFDGDFVIDFDSKKWVLGGDPSEYPYVHVLYEVAVKLVRLRDGRIIWRGACDVAHDVTDSESGEKMSLEQIPLAEWQPLREAFKEAADKCAQVLLAQFIDPLATRGATSVTPAH